MRNFLMVMLALAVIGWAGVSLANFSKGSKPEAVATIEKKEQEISRTETIPKEELTDTQTDVPTDNINSFEAGLEEQSTSHDSDTDMNIPAAVKNYKQVQTERKKAEANSWNGEWTRVSVNNPGTLMISNHNGNTFDLVLDVTSGVHPGSIEGKAAIKGNQAVIVNEEWNCRLNLTLNKNAITIIQTEGCSQLGGEGMFFDGEYKNPSAAASTPKDTLSSLKIIDPKSDAVIQKLLGKDYDELVQNMQLVDDASDFYGFEGTLVLKGGVRGLYTLKEGIIVKDSRNHYYIGNLTDGKVKFYTNDPAYYNKLHGAVDEWRTRFTQYPVEYFHK